MEACGVPVVCVVVEGGLNTIRTVLEYVTDTPPVPVVICDGSGRAADLLAFAHRYMHDDDSLLEDVKEQLLMTIERTFHLTRDHAEKLHCELMQCVRRKDLRTLFQDLATSLYRGPTVFHAYPELVHQLAAWGGGPDSPTSVTKVGSGRFPICPECQLEQDSPQQVLDCLDLDWEDIVSDFVNVNSFTDLRSDFV
ncbi:transient receptor potential cation channel trpm [Trichonephila clavipes]|nr:transient receptor potential cation channel trpm [Trichonephila clavipes]